MNKILNLTQHKATADQVAVGVVDLADSTELKAALTFNTIPSKEEITAHAEKITAIAQAENATAAMIGGAPYLMSTLESVLKNAGIKPLYAFAGRVTQEKILEDGTVEKISVFKHAGFVEV